MNRGVFAAALVLVVAASVSASRLPQSHLLRDTPTGVADIPARSSRLHVEKDATTANKEALATHAQVGPFRPVAPAVVSETDGGKNYSRPASMHLFLAYSGIEEIQNVINPILTEAILSAKVPDIHVSAVGINVYCTNITLTNFSLGAETIQLVAPDMLYIRTNDLNAIAVMNWEYHDLLIDIKGTAKDVIGKTSLTIGIKMDGSSGRLSVAITECSVDIGDFKIILDGGSSTFYQAIVDLLNAPLRHIFQDVISSVVLNEVNSILQKVLPLVPVSFPLIDNTLSLDYALINSSVVHALVGKQYTENDFNGNSSPFSVDSFSVSISAYHSFDISGLFMLDVNTTVQFQVHYDQRYLFEFDGQSIGKLEPHNPGMCWPETNTDTMQAVNVIAGQYYPIRLRYQSGCGGGSIELRSCINGSACVPLDARNISSGPALDFPLTIDSQWISVSSGAEVFGAANPVECSAPHSVLPVTLPESFNQTAHQIGIYIDPFLLTSILSSAAQTGLLSSNLTDATLPPAIKKYVHLNTTFFRFVFPNLYNKFPDTPMGVAFTPTSVADVVSDTTGLSGGIRYTVNMYLLIGGQSIPAVQMSMNASMAGFVDVQDNRLTGEINSLVLTVDLDWAIVPVYNISALNPLLSTLINDAILPALNSIFSQGIPLPPLAGFSLVNVLVSYMPGYFSIFAAVESNSTAIAAALSALKLQE